ncbi:MAG: tetraacyldisaccharide 4'-kinase [Candidatus Eisenbacteria sp.]|nr:tetraacyldisaccharide 4'-kinase [Candidatus Eisenbacteria bacterium]
MNRDALTRWHRRLGARDAGWGARLADVLLAPVAGLYRLGVAARNRAYDREWLPVRHAGVWTLGIGGLSAGGSGKTPLAALLATWLAEWGYHPLLVARGYAAPEGGGAPVLVTTGEEAPRVGWRRVGEEAILLARLARGVPVAVARRREEALSAARAAGLAPDCLVLDGSFQHRRLRADLSLVSLDAARAPGEERLLPRGMLREPWSSLRRADLVVLHRAERCSDPGAWERFLDQVAPGLPRAWCANRWELPRELRTGRSSAWDTLRQGRYAVWTALARPESFLEELADRRILVQARVLAADHAAFGPREAERLAARVAHERLVGVLTTEKDAVKLERFAATLPPTYVIPARLEWTRGEEVVAAAMRRALP